MITKIKLIKNNVVGIIEKLDYSDVDDIIDLQNNVVTNLTNKDIFQPDTKEFITNHIKKQGKIVGCKVENKLIAYAVLRFPMYKEDNLGIDIKLDYDKLKFVVHFESIAVLSDYRGNNLQQLLCNYIETIAINKGMKYLLATVSPDNIQSLNNFNKLGFEVKLEKTKYNGLTRYILSKAI